MGMWLCFGNNYYYRPDNTPAFRVSDSDVVIIDRWYRNRIIVAKYVNKPAVFVGYDLGGLKCYYDKDALDILSHLGLILDNDFLILTDCSTIPAFTIAWDISRHWKFI